MLRRGNLGDIPLSQKQHKREAVLLLLVCFAITESRTDCSPPGVSIVSAAIHFPLAKW